MAALQQAVDVRLNSKTARRLARVNIETELARGAELIRDLDVMVAVAAKDAPARLAAWHTARRVEGIRSSSDAAPAVAPATTGGVSPDQPTAGPPLPADAASPPAAEPAASTAPLVERPPRVLDKAS